MRLSRQQPLPLAAAVLVAGTLLPFSSEEAPAPPLVACRPVRIEALAPLADPERVERRLARYLAQRYMVGLDTTERVVLAAYSAADEVGLDPLLLLAVAAVESSFNPLAESVMGAKGLMQIIPRYHRDKLERAGGDQALFDPEASMLLGARILQEYVRRTGTLRAGLQFYNGAYLDASAQYARKVMAERARLEAVVERLNGVHEATLTAAAT